MSDAGRREQGEAGDPVVVDDATGPAWDAAISSLARGGSILWRGIGVSLSPRALLVQVKTEWEPDQMTRARAEIELLQARGAIAELAGDSRDFAKSIDGKKVSYTLIAGEGDGSVTLASLRDSGFIYGSPGASIA